MDLINLLETSSSGIQFPKKPQGVGGEGIIILLSIIPSIICRIISTLPYTFEAFALLDSCENAYVALSFLEERLLS